MAQVQVITGIERRRRWSESQKRSIVAAAFAPGAIVKAVAQQADINTGLIYRWRRELSEVACGFSEVVMTGHSSLASQSEAPAIEVVIGGNVHLRILATSPPDLAAVVVKALAGR